MKEIQSISTTVLYICRSRIWTSVVMHSVALYSIWLYIKCQTSQELTIQITVRFQSIVFHQSSPGQQPPWKFAQEADEGFWKKQADCRCRAPENQPLSCCQDLYFWYLLLPNNPALPHKLTPTYPEGGTSLNRQRWVSAPWHWIPKVLQVSWGLSMLPCNSSNEDSPSKDTKLTEHTVFLKVRWHKENTAREELESWVLFLPMPVPFCMTQNCLFTLPPNLFLLIYGIHTHLPEIFHELIWSGNVGRAVTKIQRGFLKYYYFY